VRSPRQGGKISAHASCTREGVVETWARSWTLPALMAGGAVAALVLLATLID
jgi:hypothetical protein